MQRAAKAKGKQTGRRAVGGGAERGGGGKSGVRRGGRDVIAGTPFAPDVLESLAGRRAIGNPLFVVSIGDAPPERWGGSAGAFYRALTAFGINNSTWNAQIVGDAWRAMQAEVRARGHRSVQAYYAADRVAVPIWRLVRLATDDTPEPVWRSFLLLYAPDFAAVRPRERATRLLVDCYRVAIAAAGGSDRPGRTLVTAPLAAGRFAGAARDHVLRVCATELLTPAPALGDAHVAVFCFDQDERAALTAL